MTMTVESALSSVQTSARQLGEAVQELMLIAVEDRPRGADLHLTTLMHDGALDLAAEAEQARAALQRDRQPVGVSLLRISHDVADCHAHVNNMGAVLARELATPERLNDLAGLGRERGREAGAWATEIVRCIESCQQLIWIDMQPALLGYWRELAEAANRTVRPAAEAELEREGHNHDG